MSYDIRFAVKVADHEDLYAVIGEPERNSPTYNIGDMLRKCMGWDFHQGEWYQVTEIIPHVERGIHELTFNQTQYRCMEPDNGWGSCSTALYTLQSIMDWLTEEWGGIKGSWNADIPLEWIYMSW